MTVSRTLRYLWASPASAVGLLLAAIAGAFGARIVAVDGVVEVAGGRLAAAVVRLPRACRFDAITFGHVVLGIDRERLDACRRHERVHVSQYERWGLLFFALYLGSSGWQWLCGRDPYRDNCFEREAYAADGTRFSARP